LILLLIAFSGCISALSQNDFNNIQSSINSLFVSNSDNIPKAVRLSFHDCVGGCDGCINPNDPGNNGLAGIVQTLEAVYTSYSSLITRADFWAAAGHAALLYASPAGAMPPLEFYWGRVSCATSPNSSVIVGLPNPEGDFDEVDRVFVMGMNLTAQQSVVLIGGGHALGHAHANVSGYNGPWTDTPLVFSNKFFIEASSVDRDWVQTVLPTMQHQWNNTDMSAPKMMLNTDLSMYRNLELDGNYSAGCPYLMAPACPAIETSAAFDMYAANSSAFLNDFAEAWTIMLMQSGPNGATYNNLTMLTGSAVRTASISFGLILTVVLAALNL